MRYSEIISEVKTIHHDQRDDDELFDTMLRYFNLLQKKLEQVDTIDGLSLLRGNYGYSYIYFFVDNNKPIGFSMVDRRNPEVFMVSLIFLTNPYRKSGIGLKFYQYLLENYTLISDTHQTVAAQSLWRKLGSMPEYSMKKDDNRYVISKHPMAELSEEDDYRGEHSAPSSSGDAPLYNLTINGIYPEDVYSSVGYSYYGDDDSESFYQCMAYKGRPNKPITIYRAVPADLIRPKINVGDWVTTSRAYAKEHGVSNLKNKYKIITKSVFARDLYTEGNSLAEWGYDPQPFISRENEDRIRVSLGMLSVAEARAAAAARKANQ